MATIWRMHPGEQRFAGLGCEPLRSRDVHGPDVETCSFCGLRFATAVWHGHQRVSVCRSCVVDCVAPLVGDALVGEGGHLPATMPNLQREYREFDVAFWRAVAGAIHRSNRAVAKRREPCRCGDDR